MNSKDKGNRAEYKVRDVLREITGLQWERTPSSGALAHYKGDLILPPATNCISKFTIEVKHYADDLINCNLLTGNPEFYTLWGQTVRQAIAMNAVPMMVFKKDRGKLLVAVPFKYKDDKHPYLVINNQTKAEDVVVQDLVSWATGKPKEFFAHILGNT